MHYSLTTALRKISRSLRTWVDIKIQALIWPIVYREVKTMLDKFELSDEASEEIKNRLLLVDHDEMKSAIDNEIYKRELIDRDDLETLMDERLADCVDSDTLTDRLEHYSVEADYNDLSQRMDDIDRRVDMIVEKLATLLDKIDNIDSGRKEARLLSYNIGEALKQAGISIQDQSMEEE